MSLLTKHLFNNFCPKHVSFYRLFRNEISFINAQYYTLMSSVSSQRSDVFKPKMLRMRKVVTLPSVKHSLSNVGVKFIEVLKNVFGSGKEKYIGCLWYSSLDLINIQEFFTLLEMPDTFYSRFKIIELHVWMLLYHLPQGTRPKSLVRIGLMEAMWRDTENRARLVHKYNLNFKKNMRTFYGNFKLHMLIYDEGFYGDDMALTNALWFAFFDKGDVDPRILEALVSYVRHQMNHLNELNMERLPELEEAKLWFPLEPHVKNIFNKL